MSNLTLFEDFAEGFFEGTLAHLLGGRLQPEDIANSIARAMEDNRTVSPKGYLLAPNRFVATVNPADYQALRPDLEAIQRRLSSYTMYIATRENLGIRGRLQIFITSSASVPIARVRISAYVDTQPPDDGEAGCTEPMSYASGGPLVDNDCRKDLDP